MIIKSTICTKEIQEQFKSFLVYAVIHLLYKLRFAKNTGAWHQGQIWSVRNLALDLRPGVRKKAALLKFQ